MQLRVLRLESSIVSIPTYLSQAYLEGTYKCGLLTAEFDASDQSLVYLAGLYMDPNPSTYTIEYFIMLDRALFHLLQFLKRIGLDNAHYLTFGFFDDVNDDYEYNDYGYNMLTDVMLLDLLIRQTCHT